MQIKRSCPFCGESKDFDMYEYKEIDNGDKVYGYYEYITAYAVRCQYCDAKGPSSSNIEQAIVEWNYGISQK